MQPIHNKMNKMRRISRNGHRFHKEEINVYVRSYMHICQFSGEKYKRLHHTWHGIDIKSFETDSDYHRECVDERSHRYRGYSTSEF